MSGGYVELSAARVVLAATLLVAAAALAYALRVRLGTALLVAAVRTSVQLIGIGLVLRWVFAERRWYVTAGLLVSMTIIAGISGVRRTSHRYAGIWTTGLASVAASGWTVTAFALFAVVRPAPWYAPQYAIPLAGIVLGNTLTGISLALDRFGEELTTKRDRIEGLLALGATGWEAARGAVQDSIRAGMVPTINAMLVAGVVSLPGAMTGQLLSGVDALSAAKYQIVIMFLIASGSTIGTVSVVVLSFRRLFSADHQFLRAKLDQAERR